MLEVRDAGQKKSKKKGSSKNVVFFFVLRFWVGHLQKIPKRKVVVRVENCNGRERNQDTNVAHLLLIFL